MSGIIKRQFIRDRRKALKQIKKGLSDLRRGCAMKALYGDDTTLMTNAVHGIESSVKVIDEITKKLAR